MAVIRDVIPAFELFQPVSVSDALALLDEAWHRRVGAGRRARQHGVVEGPHQAPARAGGRGPEKWWLTRAMVRGWVTRRQYLEHHDPMRWMPR